MAGGYLPAIHGFRPGPRDENADVVYRELIDKYGFTVNPSGGDHAKKMFRVAHVGNHSIENTEELVLAIEEIINSKK